MPTKLGTYLDANAGAPLKPAAVDALYSIFQGEVVPANASSIHVHGRNAKRLLALAREKVAASLGVDPEQILFTSCGSEANQLAISSVLGHSDFQGNSLHWITTPVEHDSTLQMVEEFKARGGEVSFLPLDATGAVDVNALPQLIRPETCLISAVWVNNETGIIHNIQELIRIARTHFQSRKIPVHIDAAQAWGKIPIDLEALGAQYVSFSGHKIGALSGIGALWLGRGCSLKALLPGKQERGVVGVLRT